MSEGGLNRESILDIGVGELPEVKTSDVLARFRESLPSQRVSLANLIQALGDRSLGTVLLALSLPTIAPVPLGVSCIADLPLLLFAVKLCLGRKGGILPGWVMRRSVSRNMAEKMIDTAMPRMRGIEKMLKPRNPALAYIDGKPWFGWLILLLGLTCIIPLPLTGWLPGFALVLLSLGLIERDGNAVAISLLMTVAGVLFFGIVASGITYAGQELLLSTD